jgi:hypothetical protein
MSTESTPRQRLYDSFNARDLNGAVVFDNVVIHAFRIENGLVSRFDIRPTAG